MKTVLLVLLLSFICLHNVVAQMPECSKLYMVHNSSIYNFDPTLPVSATNPVLNTITLPGTGGNLAICPQLNSTSTTPVFYAVVNNKYAYYNGTAWIHTGHNASAPNIAGGGGYIFGLDGPSGRVYRYDGLNEILITTVQRNCAPYDLIADCDGNWYLLSTMPGYQNFLNKYDANGVMLKSWQLVNPGNLSGSGGFGIIGNTIYFDTYVPPGVAHGVIGDSTVVIDPNVIYGPTMPAIEDYATCPSSVNLSLQLEIKPDRDSVCPNTPVTFTSHIRGGGFAPNYQWRVNGVNTGTNSSTFTYTPVNNDIVTCVLTVSGNCSGIASVTSNAVKMVVFTIPVVATVVIHNTTDGFCLNRPATIKAVQTYGGIPFWQWFKNGVLVGTNADEYTDSTLATGDQIYVVMLPNSACAVTVPITSNTITVNINSSPVVPGININSIPPVTLCEGAFVSFVSNDYGGGLHPQYVWYKNGTQMGGAGMPDYTELLPMSGDTFMVELISSAACPLRRVTPSNKMGLTVTPMVSAYVSIAANPGTNIASGQFVTFTANCVNGGSTPIYRWYRNGMLVAYGPGNTWSTNNLGNNDYINAVLETHVPCPTATFVTSNALKMQVGSTGVRNINDNILSLYPNPNAGHFAVNIVGYKASEEEPLLLEVMNALGQQVYRQVINNNSNAPVAIELNKALPDGYYLLKLHQPDMGVVSTPFILKK